MDSTIFNLDRIKEAVKWYSRNLWYAVKAARMMSTTTHLQNSFEAEFLVDSGLELRRASTLMGERDEIQSFIENIESTDVVFDIGANIGMYACFACQAVEEGHLVAFEPQAANANRLRENLKRNCGYNWTVIEGALSDSDGTTYLREQGTIPGVGTHSIGTTGTVEVPQWRLDTLLESRELPLPTVMKIDIEGAEGRMLEGARNCLNDVRLLQCEVHPQKLSGSMESVEDIEALLVDEGFEIHERAYRGMECHLVAVK